MKLYILILDEIKQNLNFLREYNNFLEDFLKNKVEKFKAWIDREADKLPEDEKVDFFDYFSDEYLKLYEDFPNIARGSLFVAGMSMLEYQIIALCQHLQKTNRYYIALNDIAGKGIFKAQLYLKKVAKLKFPDDTKYWNDILCYQIIRNAVVHNDSVIKNGKELEKIIGFSLDHKSLRMHSDRLLFGETFCLEAFDIIESFFDILFKNKELV
ncbi:MAG: hypothetical protein PHO03_04010 [Candidatus Omnitrophica bacterium]|nr:hypothetical protein [Candidatus Omnitrophota bacterium]